MENLLKYPTFTLLGAVLVILVIVMIVKVMAALLNKSLNIHPVFSWAAFIALHYFITYPLLLKFGSQYISFTKLVPLAAFLVTVGWFGYCGWVNVPIGYVGVPTFLGARIPFFVLSEGVGLVLPRPFMSVVNVDARELVIMISPKDIEKTSGKVLTMGAGAAEGEMAEADIAGELKYKVINAYRSLSVTDVDSRIANKALSILRTLASVTSIFDFIRKKDDAANSVASHGEMVTEAKACGVEFIGFLLRKILPSDKELIRAAEAKIREQMERGGEEVEVTHVITQVKRIALELKISEAEAMKAFRLERGKAKQEYIDIGTSGDLSKIERAAILASRNQKGTNP